MRTRLRAVSVGAVLLAFGVASASAGAKQLRLRPADIHRFAEQATVVRGLLRIEDSLTYDAVALRPARRALARRIREQNQVLISLCRAVIRDDARIRRAERELRRAHRGRAAIDIAGLQNAIADATADVEKKLKELQKRGENISIADMFEMQMLMNKLAQLSEMSSAVVSASNSAISSMARTIKG